MSLSLPELLVSLAPSGLASESPAASVEAALDSALASARAAWPRVSLAAEAFVRYLAERLPPDAGSLALALERLPIADLWLACACSSGDPAALEAFDATILARLDRALGELAPGAHALGEVKQRVRSALFVADPGGRPAKIAEYRGRSSLARWVRVVAMREALQQERSDRREEARARSIAGPELIAASPELELLRAQFGSAIQAILARAVGTLSPRERNVLQLHLIGRASLSDIGRAYGVNKSTVSRWLASTHDTLLATVRRALRDELGVEDSTVDSLIRAVRDGLDFSLERILAK